MSDQINIAEIKEGLRGAPLFNSQAHRGMRNNSFVRCSLRGVNGTWGGTNWSALLPIAWLRSISHRENRTMLANATVMAMRAAIVILLICKLGLSFEFRAPPRLSEVREYSGAVF